MPSPSKTKVYPARRDPKAEPMHPGKMLASVLPALGKPKTEIATLLGVSRRQLYDVLEEKTAISAPMALRIGKLCGNGPEAWMALQAAYDLHHARKAIGAAVAKIPTLEVAEINEPI